ncbi:MAG TPA: phosphomannomutase/phosphoglucomutase [Longimicrobiaceae bacterium]
MVNPHVFRQYDIRGVVGRDLDTGFAEALGRAFGTMLVRRRGGGSGYTTALGRDNRVTSDDLAAGIRRGLVAAGIHVIDVGTVPTPVLSFAAAELGTDGAIQVTGSHNPPEYNGFKLTIDGRSLYGQAIQDLRALIESEGFVSGEGTTERRDMMPQYIESVAKRFPVQRPVKVVLDCGNGTGSLVGVDLLRAMGPQVEVVPLYCESDGTFPNHHPDPVVDANLQDLIAEVRRTHADLGIAFDGDADRIGAVDDRGEIVRGDILVLLFGLDLLERKGPGQKVVFDVKCSQALPEVLSAAGGVPIMSATGHSLIKQRMKQENAPLAGELSGHIMFGEDYYGFDDALYAAALLISILSRMEQPLSQRLQEFPRYYSTPELRYATTEEEKFDIVRRAVEHFRGSYEVVDVDGARVLFGDGWGLIRASNTEPVLVGRFEARTPERLGEIRDQMESWLRDQGIST